MNEEFKKQVVSSIKKEYKIAKNSIKNVYDKSLSFISFTSCSTLFYVVELSDSTKVNKLFNGVFDEENMVLYIKFKRNNVYEKYLKENCKIKMENNDIFIIDKVDYTKTYDYLLKINNEYKSIKCYKIILNKY